MDAVFVERQDGKMLKVGTDRLGREGWCPMQEQEQELREGEQHKNNALQKLGLLILLCYLLIVGAMVVLGRGHNNNQLCDTATNGGYNYQQAAYTMGVAAQSNRAGLYGGRGTSANLGGATITLCPANGKEYSKPSPLYEGYGYPGEDHPKNSTHSEQQAYRWVISTLTPAKLQAGDRIYVTIYSEVPVCELCKSDMVTWNADFQALLPALVKVQTQVWQMRVGSPAAVGKDPVPPADQNQGFRPGKFPAGTGFSLQFEDVEMVSIPFR